MFDPKNVVSGAHEGSATFVRLGKNAKATFENCYCTRYMGTEQGDCVFSEINVPEGCSYKMVEEPFAQYNGKPTLKGIYINHGHKIVIK